MSEHREHPHRHAQGLYRSVGLPRGRGPNDARFEPLARGALALAGVLLFALGALGAEGWLDFGNTRSDAATYLCIALAALGAWLALRSLAPARMVARHGWLFGGRAAIVLAALGMMAFAALAPRPWDGAQSADTIGTVDGVSHNTFARRAHPEPWTVHYHWFVGERRFDDAFGAQTEDEWHAGQRCLVRYNPEHPFVHTLIGPYASP